MGGGGGGGVGGIFRMISRRCSFRQSSCVKPDRSQTRPGSDGNENESGRRRPRKARKAGEAGSVSREAAHPSVQGLPLSSPGSAAWEAAFRVSRFNEAPSRSRASGPVHESTLPSKAKTRWPIDADMVLSVQRPWCDEAPRIHPARGVNPSREWAVVFGEQPGQGPLRQCAGGTVTPYAAGNQPSIAPTPRGGPSPEGAGREEGAVSRLRALALR